MELKPIKQYQEPKLPTRRIIDECPQLLELIPRRWQTNPVVLSALAGVCTLMLGSRMMADEKPQPATQVAPIFKHGEGRGAFGCVAVNPPVFLSEDEARKVILEEATKAGITFVDKGKIIPNVAVPVTSTYPGSFDEDKKKPKPTQVKPLKLDGVDEKRVIAFEYVSKDDFSEWETEDGNPTTVSAYDLIETARTLRKGLAKAAPEGTYAVFYDPMIGSNDARKKGVKADDGEIGDDRDVARVEMNGMANSLAREQLRKQVQDFIKWLKTQGVI